MHSRFARLSLLLYLWISALIDLYVFYSINLSRNQNSTRFDKTHTKHIYIIKACVEEVHSLKRFFDIDWKFYLIVYCRVSVNWKDVWRGGIIYSSLNKIILKEMVNSGRELKYCHIRRTFQILWPPMFFDYSTGMLIWTFLKKQTILNSF